jgi:hypothetical protein
LTRRTVERATHTLALAVLVFLSIEVFAAVTTGVLCRRGWMAYIPRLRDEQTAVYLARRSPRLGWGPATDVTGQVLNASPRHDPASPRDEPPCVSAYGDSFTFGDEAGEDGTYPHRLAERIRCPVWNFGQRGYGTDQALMLFRSQGAVDRAPVVILGHTSENILRNVNQYRNLLYPGPRDELAFKPRFVASSSGIEYVPVPVDAPDDFRRLSREPESVLTSDFFVQRPRRSFPYSVALGRWAAFDFHVRARLAGRPWYASFYEASHPSRALELTTRILSTFADEAVTHRRRPVALLIPTGLDFLEFRRTRRWVDEPLAEALRRQGSLVIHAGPAMLARLGGADPCGLFGSCHAHFNSTGYSLLGDVVAEELARAGLTPAPAGAFATGTARKLAWKAE